MDKNLRSQSRQVVELLTSWGATAEAATADLLAVLAAFGRSDVRSSVRRVLETPGIELPEQLRRDAGKLLDDASAGLTPELEDRLTAVAAQLDVAVRSRVATQRQALAQDVESWGPLLAPSELDSVCERVWRHEDTPDPLSAARDLEGARDILGKARWRIDEEVRARLEALPEDEATRGLASRARAALDGADPWAIASARLELAERGAREDATDTAATASDVARKLQEVVDRGRAETNGKPGRAGLSADLLRAALTPAESLLERMGSSSDAALLRQADAWQRALAGMLQDDPADWDRSPEARAKLARGLVSRLEAEGPAELDEIKQALVQATDSEAGSFTEAFVQAAASLAVHGGKARAGWEKAATGLREAARELESDLQRCAASLPSKQVVETRVLLERVEETIARADVEAIDALTAEAGARSEAIGRIFELSQQHQQSRVSAERKRLSSEAGQLLAVATGGSARRLRALVKRIDDAKGASLRGLSGELRAARESVGNSIRLRTARVLERLEKRRDDSDEAAAELRRAFEEDDLATMGKLVAERRRELATGKLPLRLGLVALAVVILVGAVFGWQRWTRRAHEYRLELAPGDPMSVQLLLVGEDGDVEVEALPGSSTSVSLKPGHWELFVNGRYTGRVIRVPEDPAEVEGIPVLPPLPGT
jgi:hypothetical protein